MTEVERTLGPWFYVDSIDAGEFFGCGVADTEGGPEFIWFDDAIEPDRDIARARLIAAAPELLSLLKEVMMEDESAWVMGTAWHAKAEAIIAKAEGRS